MKFDNVMQTFGDDLKPFAPKIYIVNCPKCGAALKVKDGAAVYACGACNYLFQIRKVQQNVTEEKDAPQEETVKEESLEMQTPEAENMAEEPCDERVETPAEESKEEAIEWQPTIDEEDSEDGWEEDNRQMDIPVWQEEEAEEGWDEE
jgi:DNA-directed RNA polymerase subunit M/transcription elongation factor TFIIS